MPIRKDLESLSRSRGHLFQNKNIYLDKYDLYDWKDKKLNIKKNPTNVRQIPLSKRGWSRGFIIGNDIYVWGFAPFSVAADRLKILDDSHLLTDRHIIPFMLFTTPSLDKIDFVVLKDFLGRTRWKSPYPKDENLRNAVMDFPFFRKFKSDNEDYVQYEYPKGKVGMNENRKEKGGSLAKFLTEVEKSHVGDNEEEFVLEGGNNQLIFDNVSPIGTFDMTLKSPHSKDTFFSFTMKEFDELYKWVKRQV